MPLIIHFGTVELECVIDGYVGKNTKETYYNMATLAARQQIVDAVKTLEEYGTFFSKKKEDGEIRDFEIRIIINNTQDNTEEVVKKLQKKHIPRRRQRLQVQYLLHRRHRPHPMP